MFHLWIQNIFQILSQYVHNFEFFFLKKYLLMKRFPWKISSFLTLKLTRQTFQIFLFFLLFFTFFLIFWDKHVLERRNHQITFNRVQKLLSIFVKIWLKDATNPSKFQYTLPRYIFWQVTSIITFSIRRKSLYTVQYHWFYWLFHLILHQPHRISPCYVFRTNNLHFITDQLRSPKMMFLI